MRLIKFWNFFLWSCEADWQFFKPYLDLEYEWSSTKRITNNPRCSILGRYVIGETWGPEIEPRLAFVYWANLSKPKQEFPNSKFSSLIWIIDSINYFLKKSWARVAPRSSTIFFTWDRLNSVRGKAMAQRKYLLFPSSRPGFKSRSSKRRPWII